jgi:hypothetical protein
MTADYPSRPSLPPIVCAPWCTDGDGHPHEHSEGDQVCWGDSSDSSYVHPSHEPASLEPNGAWLTRVGVMAHRGFGEEPDVYLHVERFDPDYDVSVKLTADEGRQLAANLIEVADLIDGRTR